MKCCCSLYIFLGNEWLFTHISYSVEIFRIGKISIKFSFVETLSDPLIFSIIYNVTLDYLSCASSLSALLLALLLAHNYGLTTF